MASRLRAGILGTGHSHAIGKSRALQASEDFELVGVCEPDPDLLERQRRRPEFRDVTWMHQDELLGTPELKMVAVESPTPVNMKHALLALEAGAHIHLDKPPGTNLEDLRGVVQLADSKHLFVQMGYMFRYNTAFELAFRAAHEGWLGEVYSLAGSICTNYAAASRRKVDRFPGGIMFELACHLIDAMVWVLGKPDRVTPFLRHNGQFEDRFEDNTLAVFEYPRAMAVIQSGAMEIEPFRRRYFHVVGTRGSVAIRPFAPATAALALAEPRGGYKAGWQEVALESIPRYVRDFVDLAGCIRQDRPPRFTPAHDLAVQETLLRACGVITDA